MVIERKLRKSSQSLYDDLYQETMEYIFLYGLFFFSRIRTCKILAWHIQIQPPPGLHSRCTQYIEIKNEYNKDTHTLSENENGERNIYMCSLVRGMRRGEGGEEGQGGKEKRA